MELDSEEHVETPARRRGAATLGVQARGAFARPPGLAVRPRRDDDCEGLWHLFNQEQFQHFGALLAPFDSPADVRAWIDANGSGNYEIVGIVDGAIVAFAGLYPLRGRQSHVGWISLSVYDAFQGRKIGTLLLSLIIASAEGPAGLRRLQLHVLADNTRAIALYRSFGFCIEGRHEGLVRRGTRYVDAFTMARLLCQRFGADSTPDLARWMRRLPRKEAAVASKADAPR